MTAASLLLAIADLVERDGAGAYAAWKIASDKAIGLTQGAEPAYVREAFLALWQAWAEESGPRPAPEKAPPARGGMTFHVGESVALVALPRTGRDEWRDPSPEVVARAARRAAARLDAMEVAA